MKNYLKELIEEKGIEIPELLPKHWVPKGSYLEISKGVDKEYTERIIRREDLKLYISDGWRITRLTKISMSMIHSKWKHAIVAMENNC
ncbi:hypothetical protein Acj9p052 [Acinetobacter phage Acj9]|uniref:Uncharacterized protein n=1 Tax=Acinetobacter phage Acj9 TaxID=760939 RepID=E5EPI6_9CAUD|nr:hypothetical protein Acj9p052 [Acinetobacter phage Acj9]ADG59952.1 hypothetical protein Acj9p052 [Acinetobacter phage Acj9]